MTVTKSAKNHKNFSYLTPNKTFRTEIFGAFAQVDRKIVSKPVKVRNSPTLPISKLSNFPKKD